VKLRRFVAMSTLAAVLAVGAAACGTSGADDGSAMLAGPVVVIKNTKFGPSSMTVKAGQPVTWQFSDGFTQHNVVGQDFASNTQRNGTFSHTFSQPGTYSYRCTLHSNMTGTITVIAAQ
jgi:plastocyanin